MAITAPAQSALSDLSWDETIVPTLRKRLESESRAISKRMSTVSMATGEDGALSYPQTSSPRPSAVTNKQVGPITPSSMNSERPSAIPRPSLNHLRPIASPANSNSTQINGKNGGTRPAQQRVRTFSQPFAADAVRASSTTGSNGQIDNSSKIRTANALPTPASSRSNSPVLPPSPVISPRDARSSKAPAAKRGDQSTSMFSRPMQLQDEYSSSRDRWEADEDKFDASFSSTHMDVRQVKQNGLLQEPPPFSANSSFTSEVDERPSLEERPYEHWYRGDISRNGGVGELRIGNRMEMLEIASYGHKLQKVRNDTLSRQRRRAESIGHRESIIFAQEQEEEAQMVIDEAPLTDMEADTEFETDREQVASRDNQMSLEQPKRGDSAETNRNHPSTPRHRQPTQRPGATPSAPRTTSRVASEPLHSKSLSSPTSSTMTPFQARSPANGTKAKIPNSQSQPLGTPSQKRGRTKSPAATPSSKKPRPSAVQQKRAKSTGAAERLRPTPPSEYPEVPDVPGSMADAIPSWTQPKKAGNWDDVVLPVVARKMGLEDQYEEAHGSPKLPCPPSEEVAPPQPGTFAFDASKRRERCDPATGEYIPMEELKHERIEEEMETSPTKTIDVEDPTSKRYTSMMKPNGDVSSPNNGFMEKVRRFSPPASPAPFAEYQRLSTVKPGSLHEPSHETAVEEVEKHAGCCGCTIM